MHPDLLTNERVKIKLFETREFKRGLDPEEKPFPVSPQVGPYLIEKPVFGAKNYYWCSCGMSREQVSHFCYKLSPFNHCLSSRITII